MYCEQCQREVTSQKNPHTGTVACSQCGTEKKTPIAANSQTIAQTAHALLKRWEESRPQQQTETDSELSTSENMQERARDLAAASGIDISSYLDNFEQDSVFEEEPVAVQKSWAKNSMEQPAPPSSKTSEAIPPKSTEPATYSFADFSETMPQEEAKPAVVPSAATQRTAPPIPEKPSQISKPLDAETLSYKEALLRSMGTPQKTEEPKIKSTVEKGPLPLKSAAIHKPAETPPEVAQAAPIRELPKPQLQTPTQPATPQGKVRFATPAEQVEDLDIQQAIERHHRKQRNWSALLGQFLAFTGALAMTGGVAIVVGNRFGSLEVAETTGWLAMAGGHLLFILGIYTHLTSRMEQVWNDLHHRCDDLARLMLQQQKIQQKLAQQAQRSVRNDYADSTTADLNQFQRGSLTKVS